MRVHESVVFLDVGASLVDALKGQEKHKPLSIYLFAFKTSFFYDSLSREDLLFLFSKNNVET